MRFLSIAALSLGLGLAAPVAALDLGKMTESETTAFGAAVRDYLLKNPEVMMEVFQVLEDKRENDRAAGDLQFLRDNADVIYNNPADWTGGNPDGDITLVEFVDYRCGYCRRAFEDVEALVKADGKIRIVMKEFPILGDDSMASSKYAIAVLQQSGPEAYKKAHDALIAMTGPANDAALAELSAELGVDHAKVSAAMESEEVMAVIRNNHALAQALEINGTPTFIIKDTLVRGYVPLDGMKQIVAGQRTPE